MLGQQRFMGLVKECLDGGSIMIEFDFYDRLSCLDCAASVPQELLPTDRMDGMALLFANAFMFETLGGLPDGFAEHMRPYLDVEVDEDLEAKAAA